MYDLLIMPTAHKSQSTPLELSIGGDSMYVRGVQKAVQQWLMAFLTEIGSAANKTYGSSFLGSIRNMNLGNGQSITSAFDRASAQVIRWLRENAESGLTDDELVTEATLVEYSVIGDKVVFNVQLTTLAGDSAVYTIPVDKIN